MLDLFDFLHQVFIFMFPLLKKSEWGEGEESVIAEQEDGIVHKG
jgi:hypothetical protein